MIRLLASKVRALRLHIANILLDIATIRAERAENRLREAARKVARLERQRLLREGSVLERKAAGQVICHNFGRARNLRVVGGKDVA